MKATPRRIVVAGMFCGDPHQGGAVWATLQWAVGLRELGHEVLLVDHLAPGRTIRPDVERCFTRTAGDVRDCGVEALAIETDGSGSIVAALGADAAAVAGRFAGVDVLLNLSGRLRAHGLVEHVPVRVFVDLDPGFVQIWEAQGGDLGIAAHTHTATVGSNVGTPACTVPTLDHTWIHVLPPVALTHWHATPIDLERARLTTVANLRSYGSVAWQGEPLGQKVHSLRALRTLAARSPIALELAMAIHPGDRCEGEALVDAGWILRDPCGTTGTPRRYQRYLQQSWGEIGVAKQGYVAARTGWVSDRSAAYLATGRPVVVQDTGAEVLRGREGVFVFDGIDGTDRTEGALDAIGRIAAEPQRYAAAARAVAEELFDARLVLRGLLATVDA